MVKRSPRGGGPSRDLLEYFSRWETGIDTDPGSTARWHADLLIEQLQKFKEAPALDVDEFVRQQLASVFDDFRREGHWAFSGFEPGLNFLTRDGGTFGDEFPIKIEVRAIDIFAATEEAIRTEIGYFENADEVARDVLWHLELLGTEISEAIKKLRRYMKRKEFSEQPSAEEAKVRQRAIHLLHKQKRNWHSQQKRQARDPGPPELLEVEEMEDGDPAVDRILGRRS